MTSASASFPQRLTRIDELTRNDHSFLLPEDECLFFGDYSARKGFAHSPTNQLILNFKKPCRFRNSPSWYYKTLAIAKAAELLSRNIGKNLPKVTLVPVPPSKVKAHPEYDDRLMDMLRLLKGPQGELSDVRELVTQKRDMPAAHESGNRSRPGEWEDVYEICESITHPEPTWIGVIDDVIVTGCRFRAMSNILRRRFADARITGIFLARRVPDASDISEFFDPVDN